VKTRIKICCISSIAEAQMAVAAGADALGLVAQMPSGPGVVDDAIIREIALSVPPPASRFLLTSETVAAMIASHIDACGVDTVQVVNHVDPAELARLAVLRPHIRRVQVIHVEDRSALNLIDRYAAHADAFLLDSGRPAAAIPELGGTGRVHDWTVSAEFVARSPIPVFLAGGLKAGNVAAAIAQVRPYGLDLCSGVRTGGRLDHAKLRRYIEAIHTVDQA
jgi:phosphoribosylanthranilate isomerase